MTPDLAAKARALSPDARRVLVSVADFVAGTHAEIAERTGLPIARVRKACETLQRGPGFVTVRTTHEYGLGLHGSGRLLAEAVREVPADGQLLSGEA
jgi:DNA-binding IclR family transcriptional regulator